MYASEILELFEPFQIIHKNFLGTFPLDKIPKDIPLRHFAIVNTAFHDHPGKHWFVLYQGDEMILQYFDCLGSNEAIKKKLRHFKEIECNSNALMRSKSKYCGYFSVYFSFQRLFHPEYSFHDILSEFFVKNKEENEKRVLKFVQEILH